MTYRDSHVHLLDCRDDIAAIKQARKAGVRQIFCNTTSAQLWQPCSDLAENFPEVIPFFGLHPWFVSQETIHDLRTLPTLLSSKAAGVGEIGLDKRCRTDFAMQKRAFCQQIEIAIDNQAFIAIHCVRAWGTLLTLLEEYAGQMAFMIHGFNGSRQSMERLVSLGGLISFSCTLVDPRQTKLRDVFLATPLDHILLETDSPNQFSPFLVAEKKSATMENEPAMVTALYHYCAHIRKMDLTTFTQQIWHNGTIFTH